MHGRYMVRTEEGAKNVPILADIEVARLVTKPVEVADKLVADESLPASGQAHLQVGAT